MNERIKELSAQAYDDIIVRTGDIIVFQEDFEQRFAELIVRECVNWIDGSPTTEEGTLILSKSFIIANLKQHFGVEE